MLYAFDSSRNCVVFAYPNICKRTIKFNVEGLLRGDYASRMQGYATARQNGWLSANDIR